MSNEILLSKATRNELIDELRNRTSITSIKVNSGNGASIKTMNGNTAVLGGSLYLCNTP